MKLLPFRVLFSIILIATCLVCASSVGASWAPAALAKHVEQTHHDFKWVLSYNGQLFDSVRGDKRYKKLIRAVCPLKRMDWGVGVNSLTEQLMDNMNGSPDKVKVSQNRYVWLSAAHMHGAENNGFIWLDIERGVSVVGLEYYKGGGAPNTEPKPYIYLTSTTFGAYSELPAELKSQIKQWMEMQIAKPVKIEFEGKTGLKTISL